MKLLRRLIYQARRRWFLRGYQKCPECGGSGVLGYSAVFLELGLIDCERCKTTGWVPRP